MVGLTREQRERAGETAGKKIAADLQQVIRRHINRENLTVADMAAKLDLEPETVNSLMKRDTWAFGLCVEIIGLLDIPVRVTGSHS